MEKKTSCISRVQNLGRFCNPFGITRKKKCWNMNCDLQYQRSKSKNTGDSELSLSSVSFFRSPFPIVKRKCGNSVHRSSLRCDGPGNPNFRFYMLLEMFGARYTTYCGFCRLFSQYIALLGDIIAQYIDRFSRAGDCFRLFPCVHQLPN